MPVRLLLVTLASLLVSQLSFGAACPVSTTSTAVGSAFGTNCTVSGSASTIQLSFNNGFSDATVIAAVGGNNGTSIGAQRKLSFIKAAEILADQVASSQVLIVDADFTLLSCDASSATLGSAGASTNTGNVAPMPAGAVINTFYPIGLINSLGNTDYAGGLSDITAQFNSNIGNVGCLQASNGWYYGFDTPPGNYIGFTTVLLHEMTHGLGFASLVDASTGVKPSGLDDIFSNNLYSQANGAAWSAAGGLSNAQRAASAVSVTGLLWNASNVNTEAVGELTAGFQNNDGDPAFTSGDRVQMYAPNPVEGGSSVSHFNTAASPDELMEPQYTAGQLNLGLALYLLKDIGWTVTPVVVANNAPTITAVDQSTNEDITKIVDASGWGNDTDGGTLAYSVNSACATNITCSINSDGTSLTMIPAANHSGGTHTITVNVDDGQGDSTSDTFNLNVIAQNDAPVIDSIPNQTIKIGESKDINLLTYSSDVDGDALTFSDTACGANLTCSFPNASTLRVAAGAGVGSTVSVTIEADDSNGGTNTDTFDVTITAAVPSTTVEVGGAAHNDGGTVTLPIGSNQINVNNGSGNYSYSLDYNSSDVSSLVTANGAGLEIGLPASGEFAGDYTLTITDDTDGDVITITVTRPLRLNWSATALLNGNSEQTLKIEGGASGTVYTLLQSGSADLIFLNDSDASITTATAENNAATFNAALVHLDSATVTDISSMDVTVQSSYDDVIESAVKVYPSSLHSFSVKNTADEVLANATAELTGNEALLTQLNIVTSYSADASGEFTVLLPDTNALPAGSSYTMNVAASGYNSEDLTLNSDNATHNLVLTEVANGITLIGAITVGGSQNLLDEPPVVTLDYADGSSDVISVSVTSATQASFSQEIDLNEKSLQLLSISQAESVTIELDVSNVMQTQTIDIFLLNNASVVITTEIDTPVDTTDGASSGGGSLAWFSLFLLVLLRLGSPLIKNGDERK